MVGVARRDKFTRSTIDGRCLALSQSELHSVLHNSTRCVPSAEASSTRFQHHHRQQDPNNQPYERELDVFAGNFTWRAWFYLYVRLPLEVINLSSSNNEALYQYIRVNLNTKNMPSTLWSSSNLTRISMVMSSPLHPFWQLFAVSSVDTTFACITRIVPTLFVQRLFVVACRSLISKFDYFNDFFNAYIDRSRKHTPPPPINAKCIGEWRRLRCDLQDLCRKIDGVFSPILFVWQFTFVCGICLEIMQFLSTKPNFHSFHDLISLLTLVLNVTARIYLYSSWTNVACKVTERAKLSPEIVQAALTMNSLPSDAKNDDIYLLLQELFEQQLTTPILTLTCWRYADIDRGIVLETYGAIFTYLVLFLEFNPNVKRILLLLGHAAQDDSQHHHHDHHVIGNNVTTPMTASVSDYDDFEIFNITTSTNTHIANLFNLDFRVIWNFLFDVFEPALDGIHLLIT